MAWLGFVIIAVDDPLPTPTRLVFSLTTTAARVSHIKVVIDALVEGQRRPPDAVYLALGPSVRLPHWLQWYNSTSKRPGVLRVLRMQEDYGPASKLLAVVREGAERAARTIVVYGDDDIVYGDRITELHYRAQVGAQYPTAFGSRRIAIGEARTREPLLEATGTVSVRASFLPEAAFGVARQPDACRLSDDYWISHYLTAVGVSLSLLPRCTYNFNSNEWPRSCGKFEPLPEVAQLGALSSRTLARDGTAGQGGGDWRDQLKRYEVCQRHLRSNPLILAAQQQLDRRVKRLRRRRLDRFTVVDVNEGGVLRSPKQRISFLIRSKYILAISCCKTVYIYVGIF